MKKLLLVTPPYHCGVVEVAGRWLPLNLLYLATAARRAEVEVSLFDAMSRFEGLDEIGAAVRDLKPDFVCIPSITATVPAACTRHSWPGKCSRMPPEPSISSSEARASGPSKSSCEPSPEKET